MAIKVNPLSDKKIKSAKVLDKDYVLSDGDRLQLRVRSNGSKIWNFNYKHPQTRKRVNINIGKYPGVSLVNARKKALSYRNLLEKQFGELSITYGFTSFELLNYIKKNSPGDMAPELDQHASHELNSRNKRICKRDGAACDIVVAGYENQMHIIAKHIINELPFDRLYFYGSERPVHVSFGPDHSRYLHVKETDIQGKRSLGKGAKNDKAISLLNESIKI